MLTHGLSNDWSFSREMIMGETREMQEMAVRRADLIELISTDVQELVKTEQNLLRHGVESLEPGVTRLEVVEDPGSIADIAGDFSGSSTHIVGQLQKLGRSTVYKMCRFLNDIQIPLERSCVAIRGWNEKEKEKYNEWRSIDPGSLNSTRDLAEAHRCLSNLVRDQLKLLRSLEDDFTNAMDADKVDENLMQLLVHCIGAQLAVQELMAQKQLERDEALLEAGEDALRQSIHPRMNAHRSTNIPLVEHIESIASLKMCEILVDFRTKIRREKERIENAIGVGQSVSGS